MSDFLARLAERQLTVGAGVAPRLPSRFANAPLSPDAPVISSLRRGGQDEPVPPGQRVVRLDVNDLIHTPAPPVEAGPSQTHVAPASRQPEMNIGPPKRRSSEADRAHAEERPLVPHTLQAAETLVPAPRVKADLSQAAIVAPREKLASARQDIAPRPHADRPVLPQTLVPRAPDVAAAIAASLPPPQPRSIAGSEPPVVKVTIGRIEVRAVMPPPPRERPAADAHKALSLEEYLERRHGGRR